MIKQELYAFWPYDLPPYYIGGKILKFLEDGFVEVENFVGFRCKPVAILPGTSGERALAELRRIGGEYKRTEAEYAKRAREEALEALYIFGNAKEDEDA